MTKKHNGYNGAENRSCHPGPFGLFKAWCFLFHVSGLSCSGHFDYFEYLRGITFFLTQQLQIAEKSCFPLLPMEMLWIAGKRLLSCNNWRAFQSWFLSLSWQNDLIFVSWSVKKSLTWIYTILSVFSTSSKFQNLVVISVKLLIIVQCLTNPLFSLLSSSSMCLNLSRSILSMSSSSGSEEDKLFKIIINWC